ncbi:histidine phosphatase family protein [Herminiimonas fonticola]|uniref:Putative phosphoglycerate mutase n=1 Tax=Herminiimonas fonticola TaxID=303380 RepID=A0A4R6G346_9BURK|nr:histidine phosphatase family protein [Herminiimonas fonticola]RBA23152.1 Fructose-26-bisphosphatase [Herminiimonas fonticola]TDN88871.1 putative phosphoglycerate mutase [Herminiimonas fonticola]
MTEILLIRHGETDWNVEKRLQGHTDIDLNREGVRQAAALGRVLLNEPLDAIFSSDLKRAFGTAQGIAIPRGMNIQLDTGLRERCFGAFEGLNHPEINERFPDDYAAWKRRDIDARYPQGEFRAETLREFSNRAVDAITTLAGAYRKVAIVTHGGVLDSVYRRAKNMGYEHPRDFDVLNASINRVTWDGSNFQILKWADVSHLSRAALDESDNLA